MKRSDIRQHIIETASFLFYKNGYNLTGINEIISKASIAKATLYNHFKSKDEICIAYLQFRNNSFLDDIKLFCETKLQGKDQILAVFEYAQNFFNKEDFNGCWCINTVSEIPRENSSIRKEIQAEKRDFMALIDNLVFNNMVHKPQEEVDTLSKQIYLLYEGAISESHLHQDNWPIEAAKDVAKKLLS